MNVASTAAISGALERSAGTVRLLAITLWAVPLAGLVSCALSLLLTFVTRDESFARQHALGFSGVIFALAACEAARGGGRRSVFGVVEVPARLYPWALLVAMQVIIPNVSFVGHLGGPCRGEPRGDGLARGGAALGKRRRRRRRAVFAAPGLRVGRRRVRGPRGVGRGRHHLRRAARRRLFRQAPRPRGRGARQATRRELPADEASVAATSASRGERRGLARRVYV